MTDPNPTPKDGGFADYLPVKAEYIAPHEYKIVDKDGHGLFFIEGAAFAEWIADALNNSLALESRLRTAEKERDEAREIIAYMRDEYSSIGMRGCLLCVYDEGVFVRRCKPHEELDWWRKTLGDSLAASQAENNDLRVIIRWVLTQCNESDLAELKYVESGIKRSRVWVEGK